MRANEHYLAYPLTLNLAYRSVLIFEDYLTR